MNNQQKLLRTGAKNEKEAQNEMNIRWIQREKELFEIDLVCEKLKKGISGALSVEAGRFHRVHICNTQKKIVFFST